MPTIEEVRAQEVWNNRAVCNVASGVMGVMVLVFSAAEYVVEKARAKLDTTNIIIIGCVTGGTMPAKGVSKAACVGCVGFAAFSILIEKFLDRHT
ncbi:unnamed protein product [Dovyalis caffra]|uniref:Uncharacterized protein n=1 Tax=Dovyalis caffra TaxID=77055 RepID=A0AAV1RMP5_9ROSI|nr:unnamed protein product [Dovyalis caffra]